MLTNELLNGVDLEHRSDGLVSSAWKHGETLEVTSMLDLLRSVDRVQAAHTARIAAMFGTEREQIAVHNTNRRSRKIDAGGSSQGRSVLHIHEVEPES